MKTETVQFVQEMADIAITCFMQNQRVTFWGYCPEVLINLARGGLLPHMPFQVVDDRAACQGKPIFAAKVESPDQIPSFRPDAVIILDPARAMKIYETAVEQYGIKPTKVFAPKEIWRQEDHFDDPLYLDCLRSIPSTIRGGLSIPRVAVHLFQALVYVVKHPIDGEVLNLGIYQGWSMYFICSLLKKLGNDSRAVLGFDSFAGMLGDHERDCFCEHQISLGKTGRNFFKDTSLALCREHLRDFDHVTIIDGNICDTIQAVKGRKVALALFDMDDYSATRAALPEVYAHLAPGGVILHDHFTFDTLCEGACVGQRLAMREFLADHPMFHLHGTNVFLKI